MPRSIPVLTALILAFAQPLLAQEAPTLTITWPPVSTRCTRRCCG